MGGNATGPSLASPDGMTPLACHGRSGALRVAGIACTVLLSAGAANAALLTGISPTAWSIADGTSNTISFTELTRLRVCVPTSVVPDPVVDGTSNTIAFSELTGVRIPWDTWSYGSASEPTCYQGIEDPRPAIVDGTSNTIFEGENPIRFQPDTRFGVCFSNVNITDGTSNTIFVAERCFDDVLVSDDLEVDVPAPAVLTLLGCGLGATAARRRRRRLP
jgi:hypothetical protein